MSPDDMRPVRVWLDDRHDPHDPIAQVIIREALFHCFVQHEAFVELPNGSILAVYARQIQFLDRSAS